jgi:hypothetical protein
MFSWIRAALARAPDDFGVDKTPILLVRNAFALSCREGWNTGRIRRLAEWLGDRLD